ncbi:MAG: 4-(cytidine 5'-diphospho)-2-C-methyl-D-erythritol kinase [Elusimicrobia bacterium]|nr:4-(cytidine 5'-diphospho)-2-C-methyl-D-erythritol kinase [Elusimicrobiota bacterium]
MKILAPAKINLFLEVKNKRADGYHNIESIMQSVSLYDELEFKPAEEKISLKCNLKNLPNDERNLVVKAAKLLKKELKTQKGARIHLKKNIPLGAGLGGGSSDAAAALKGLLKLWKLKISPKKLVKIAAKIGADVPFFLNCGTAVAKGIGDILKSIKKVKKTYFVLVFPNFGVSTPSVYKKLHFPLTSRQKINKIKFHLESLKDSKIWGRLLYNRLEEVVLPKYPKVAFIKKKIENFGYKSLMSGSGSTVFGIVPSLEEGQRLKKKLLSYKWKVWVVESL